MPNLSAPVLYWTAVATESVGTNSLLHYNQYPKYVGTILMEFLKDELFGLPPSASQAVLAEIESVVRDIHRMTISDNPDIQPDINCIRACARLSATLRFAARLREQLKPPTK